MSSRREEQGLTDGQDPVDPSVADTLSDETHEERSAGGAESHESGPDAHLERTLALEKGLGDNGAAHVGRADEKGDKGTADGH